MASMARSVNCLGQKKLYQVHLIGTKPIVQVKTWNEGQDHSSGSLLQTKQEQQHNKGAQPATATRNPPARLPSARAEKNNQSKQETLQADLGTP